MGNMEPGADRDRIADLEARLAEARQDKDRLLELLDKALTTVSSQEQRLRYLEQQVSEAPSEFPPKKSGNARKKKADIPISEVDTWEKLKNWFFNA